MNIINKIKRYFFNKRVLKEGGQAFSSTIRAKFLKDYNISIGYGTYGGCFNRKNIPNNVTFGNYCSVAQNIRIFRANHPKSYFTLHPLFYNPEMGYVEKDQLDRPDLIIGHDVWIGEWAVILPNVKKIGNGAIIGAGSIVTKDVSPYTIIGGNPARVIGNRFSPKIIIELEKTQWWEWNSQTLIKNKTILEGIINE